MDDFLTPLGFNIMLAPDAKQGFYLLETLDVDLVMLDVRMPNMNGWEMVKILREQNVVTPVLIVSANTRDTEFKLAAKGYHNGYIAKPVNLNALLFQIGLLLSIEWVYKPHNKKENTAIERNESQKPEVSHEQYQSLMALAEIGYLSGFKEKFMEISYCSHFPPNVYSHINEHIELCNFPQIIRYLKELNNE